MSTTYSKEVEFIDEDYGDGGGDIPMIGRLGMNHTSDILLWETRRKVGEGSATFVQRACFKPKEFSALIKADASLKEYL